MEPLEAVSEWALGCRLLELRLWPFLVTQAPDEVIAAHYHQTDEELQILSGHMTFFEIRNGSSSRVDVKAGERLRIPEGTVHSVTIGSGGATYVMGLRRSIPLDKFSVYLPVTSQLPRDDLAHLVEVNYAIAEEEEKGNAAQAFFENLLSEQFVFVGALGDQSMSRDAFIEGLERRKMRGRRSSGLRFEIEKSTVAAVIVVTTADGGEFLNIRLFHKESVGQWRCVRWCNARVQSSK